MTLVMLPIGRLMSAARLHSSWPVASFSRAAPGACTPAGAGVAGDTATGLAVATWAEAPVAAEAEAADAGMAGLKESQPVRIPATAAASARRPGRRIRPSVFGVAGAFAGRAHSG